MRHDSTPAKQSDDTRDAVRVYVALAMGTGTLEKAHEMEPAIDPSQIELEEVHTGMRPLDPRDAISVHPPSMIAQRVLEELSQYVRADIAERAFEEALGELGIRPDEAQSLDVREAFGGPLPRLLGDLVTHRDLEIVLENLEHALTDAHAPAVGRLSMPDIPDLDDVPELDSALLDDEP